MKKILIFTAGFGEGHNTAARNIRDAIEHIAPDEARVEVLDLFDSCYGKLNDWLSHWVSQTVLWRCHLGVVASECAKLERLR